MKTVLTQKFLTISNQTLMSKTLTFTAPQALTNATTRYIIPSTAFNITILAINQIPILVSTKKYLAVSLDFSLSFLKKSFTSYTSPILQIYSIIIFCICQYVLG